MEIPIILLSPATMVITSIYFKVPHFSYTLNDWLIGNGLVIMGIGIYLFSDKLNERWNNGNTTTAIKE